MRQTCILVLAVLLIKIRLDFFSNLIFRYVFKFEVGMSAQEKRENKRKAKILQPQFQYSVLERAQILQGLPVTVLQGYEVPYKGFKELTTFVTELFKNQGNKAVNPELGEIMFNTQSVHSSIGHRKNHNKFVAFAAVKDVIEKGVVIAKSKRNKYIYSYAIVTPINILIKII